MNNSKRTQVLTPVSVYFYFPFLKNIRFWEIDGLFFGFVSRFLRVIFPHIIKAETGQAAVTIIVIKGIFREASAAINTYHIHAVPYAHRLAILVGNCRRMTEDQCVFPRKNIAEDLART